MVKQMVVVNMAVPMSLSQLSVQISHASMLGVLNQGDWINNKFEVQCDPDLQNWLQDSFTLVVTKVWGKDSILKLREEADNLGIPTAVMVDYNMTTALAIGPADEEKLRSFKRLTLL